MKLTNKQTEALAKALVKKIDAQNVDILSKKFAQDKHYKKVHSLAKEILLLNQKKRTLEGERHKALKAFNEGRKENTEYTLSSNYNDEINWNSPHSNWTMEADITLQAINAEGDVDTLLDKMASKHLLS
tara:strand:+ start:120 stop:506 length:387 start_codon:yes stop_codon:yes gene_type:complete